MSRRYVLLRGPKERILPPLLFTSISDAKRFASSHYPFMERADWTKTNKFLWKAADGSQIHSVKTDEGLSW